MNMYEVKFLSLQDGNYYKFYVPEQMVADIVRRPEYHLSHALFMYTNMRKNVRIPTAESIAKMKECIAGSKEMAGVCEDGKEHKGKLSADLCGAW